MTSSIAYYLLVLALGHPEEGLNQLARDSDVTHMEPAHKG